MSEQRIQDIAKLAQSALLSALPSSEIGLLLEALESVTLTQGAVLALEAEPALYFVLDGALELDEGPRGRRRLETGAAFGETALVERVGTGRIMALSALRLARLSASAYASISRTNPKLGGHLAEGALRAVAERLAALEIRPAGPSGTSVGARLPHAVDGALVVAGRLGARLLSLDAGDADAAPVAPVTTREWEGRDIFRRSAGLVLLEAGRQLGVRLQLGPSITSGRLVYVEAGWDRAAPAEALDARLSELIRAAVPLEAELYSLEDAMARLAQQGDSHACLLLEDSLEAFVTLSRCGQTWANVHRPLLPHAGFLADVHVLPHPLGLLLDFGPAIRATLPPRPSSTLALELRAPRYGAPMTRSEAAWLKLLGIESVGTFNRACVQGRTAELIRVSEGFHEKRVAEIADQIARQSGVRIVAVAGPSSSGKTTFIKRLLVQLRVNGFEPLELSLDDYYADRERQARDAHGELDLEALEALDLELLRRDLAGLLEGASVRPPRYDFQRGESRPRAGEELRLGERGVVLLEGIHALNPALYGTSSRGKAFKLFIQPATSLAFDRLSSLEPAAVRLLRRIVRDRHQRGFSTLETLTRWPSVRRAERLHIFPFQGEADAVFDSSLIYEMSVLRGYAERYLREVPRSSPEAPSAHRLRQLLQEFVPIQPDQVPPTSLLREFIGGSGFTY